MVSKACLDTKSSKIKGHISSIQKDYKEIKLLSNKQSVDEILIQRAVKTTIRLLYEKGLLDVCDNADEPLKIFLSVERGRLDLEKVSDRIHGFCSQIRFEKKQH